MILLIFVMTVYSSAKVEFSEFDTTGKSVVYEKSSKKDKRVRKAGGDKISMGDYIWFDYNQNSIQDRGELGLYGISVKLYNNISCSGTPFASTRTSDIGYYRFDDISMSEQYCLELDIPSYWRVSKREGDSSFDSEGHIKNINLSISENSFDAGLYPKDEVCQTPTLKVGDIGKHNSDESWAKRASLNVRFNGFMATGYCNEYHDGEPNGENYSVHLEDRRGFSDAQRDRLSRIFRFMSDSEVISIVDESFDSSLKHIWFNVVSNSFVWYYSDWSEDFSKIEEYIDSSNWSSGLSDSEKGAMKRVSRLIIDKIENKKYQPMKVYYLWNDSNDKNQDIIVPETLLIPDRAECAIEPEPLLITIGDRVWVDSDFDGVQDSDESGYDKPMVVELYDKNSKFLAKTKTDSSGVYSFENLTSPKYYFLKFLIPDGYTISPRDKSGNCSDSDIGEDGKSRTNLYNANYDCTDVGIYIKPEPKIDIEKATNGVDADKESEAVVVEFGSTVKWSYRVHNSGNVLLKDISIADAKMGAVSCPKSSLDANESMECQIKESFAIEGLYGDTAKVIAKTEHDVAVEDSDSSYYKGTAEPKPKIDIEKATNGVDADEASNAVKLKYGSAITWSFVVTNIGNVKLDSIFVRDDREGVVKCPKIALEASKSMICTPKKGEATEGLYKGTAKVEAKSEKGVDVYDSDSSYYLGGEKPIIDPVAPVAKDDIKIGVIGKAITVKVLQNDIDADEDIDVTSVKLVHENATDEGKKLIVEDEGVWSVDVVSGDIIFSPKDGFIYDPTPVEYKVADSRGEFSNIAKIIVDYPDSGKAMLGDRVWFDMDENGKQDHEEVGLGGITVELYDSKKKIGESITDDNGSYSFSNLVEGEYFVKFIPKDGWRLTKKDAGREDLDSDADIESGKTDAILLSNGESNISWDAGMYQVPKPRISIETLTNDGNIVNIVVGDTITWSYKIKNSGSVNLSNIELTDNKEGVISCPKVILVVNEEMVCKKNGVAILGYYENNATVTSLDPDGESVKASDGSYYIGKEATVELGALGDRVWLDIDRDGIWKTTETGVSGVSVTLLDINKKEVSSTKTDENGNYLFVDLEPKEYQVVFSIPTGYKVTKQNQGGDDTKDSDVDSSGKTALLTVIAGETIKSIDMGIYQDFAKLGNRVWYDKNENGIQDSEERGIVGIRVELYNHSSVLIATKSTDSHGLYQFENISSNRYFVKFIVPDDYTVSPKNSGANSSKDSDTDSSGKTDFVMLVAGQEDNSLDMGLFQKPVKLGDRVWYDANKNGIQDSGESGIKDVKVELYRAGGEFIASTTTDSSGLYLFNGLIPSDYYILFTPSAGYTISTKDRGSDDTKDSDTNSAGRTDLFKLESGKNNASVDMGLYQQRVSFGNFVWLDTNHNGIQDEGENGVKDVNVTLFDTNGAVASILTDENGNYIFTGIPPADYYVEFKLLPSGHILSPKNEGDDKKRDSDVYKNSDNRFVTEETTLIAGQSSLEWDMGIYKTICPPTKAVLGDLVWNDVNKDGIQDIGESGIEGVKVALYNYNTDEKVATATTNENGNYEFTSIDMGEYYLIFDVPTGYFVSGKNQADSDALDSDTDREGRTDVITLKAGKINSSVDMGLHQAGSTIGDRVWYDENLNGIQDDGELGVNGVSVTLRDLADINVNSTTTNVSGEYHFTNINVGTYSVVFSNLPIGYIFSFQNQGGDESKDSDINADGESEEFSVAGATNIVSIDAGIRRYDMPSSMMDIVHGMSGDSVSLDVLSNDKMGTYSFDASTLKITTDIDSAVVSSDGKTITVKGEGVWRVNPKTGEISFIPESGFIGDPTAISYSVEDSHGNSTGSSVKVDYPPVANDDSVNGARGEKIVIHVLDNDKATSSPLNPTTLRLIDPINGHEVERVEQVGQGVWSVNSSGIVTFAPESGYKGTPTPIKYIVREDEGDISNHATITIIYPDAVDDTLIIYNSTVIDNSSTTTNNISTTTNNTTNVIYNVDVVSNDVTNIDSNEVTLGCDGDGVKVLNIEGEGEWRVNSDGSIAFTSEDGFSGDPTDIGYIVILDSGKNSNCATVDIRHEFLAIDDTTTLNIGSPTLINVIRNDRGEIVASTVELVVPIAQASLMTLSKDRKTITVIGEGIWSVNNSGLVSFTPEAGFTGTPTPIQYTVANSSGKRSNIANIIIGQSGVINIVINNDIGVANGSEPIVINILDNDKGDINLSSVVLIDSNGNTTNEIVVTGEGVWSVENGVVTFTPEEGYNGTPTSIEYTVTDLDRRESLDDEANISIEGECVCKSYKSDIPSLDFIGMALLLALVSIVGGLLFRKEEMLLS
jgi:CshA-type fibril repeat protein